MAGGVYIPAGGVRTLPAGGVSTPPAGGVYIPASGVYIPASGVRTPRATNALNCFVTIYYLPFDVARTFASSKTSQKPCFFETRRAP